MRYVLVHDEMGVYLGSCFGMGFWSKLDPIGQPCAITFPSEEVATRVWASWDHSPAGCRTIAVEASDGEYATIDDCVRAGLPAWDPEGGPAEIIANPEKL